MNKQGVPHLFFCSTREEARAWKLVLLFSMPPDPDPAAVALMAPLAVPPREDPPPPAAPSPRAAPLDTEIARCQRARVRSDPRSILTCDRPQGRLHYNLNSCHFYVVPASASALALVPAAALH